MQKIARNELIKSEVAGGCNKSSRSSSTTTIIIYVNK